MNCAQFVLLSPKQAWPIRTPDALAWLHRSAGAAGRCAGRLRRAAAPLALAGAVLLAGLGSSPAGAGGQPVIVEDGRLWASFRDTPIEQAVRAIAEQASFGVEFHADLPSTVNVLLADEPLNEALRRVLGDNSWSGKYDASGRIIELHVFGPPGEPSSEDQDPAPPAVTPPEPDEPDLDPEAREAALDAMRQLVDEGAEDATEKLSATLRDHDDPMVRWNAAIFLSEVPDRQAVEALVDKLVDYSEHPTVRRLAAWSLGQRRAENAEWALRAGASDLDDDVRQASEAALERIRNPAGDEERRSQLHKGRTMP